jgi:hypothetical protein
MADQPGSPSSVSSNPQQAISQMRQFVSNYQEAAQMAPSGSALQQAIQNYTNTANNLITDMQDNNTSKTNADFAALGRYSEKVATLCGMT